MSDRPIDLAVAEVPGGISLRVTANATADRAASFALTVAVGSNRSTHQGTATLRAGEAATLSTMTVTTAPAAAWAVTLRVEPLGGEAYELTRHSA